MEAAAILERLDRIQTALAELRAAVAATMPAPAADGADEAGDLAEAGLIDTTSAAARFNYPPDTVRKWARTEGIGIRRGGRWLISIEKLRQRINGQ